MFIPVFSPCPFLPLLDRTLSHEDVRALGADRSARFHHMALAYGQTMWRSGFPAKALLLLSRALSCRLEDVSLLEERAMPYHAVAWIVHHRPEGRFIGNPRLHYQHLASRMVEPNRELRRWRAWACWYLARVLLPESDYPSDTRQIREESTVEPRQGDIAQRLKELSPRDDLAAWESALEWSYSNASQQKKDRINIEIVPVSEDKLVVVRDLAHLIWPEVYPTLISPDQIQYMLMKMYDLDRLRQDMKEGAHFALIQEKGEPVGYLSWQPDREKNGAFLHKLYLLPKYHGQGAGAQALDWVISQAQGAGLKTLSLRVNKNNHAAVRAYLRAGFEFGEDICSEIGNGYVMDDFVMTRPV